jgi:hypothetical protein
MGEYDNMKKWKNVTEARQTNDEIAYWKTQAVASVKHMLELTAFLRHIMTLGLLRGSSRLTARALEILDGVEASDVDGSVTQDVLTDIETPSSIENTNPDYYKDEVHEFHFTEALRNLSKSRPADVSAIGVSILIDYVEELEQENKSIRHILSLWKKTEAMKEIERLESSLAALREQTRWRLFPKEKPSNNQWVWFLDHFGFIHKYNYHHDIAVDSTYVFWRPVEIPDLRSIDLPDADKEGE